MQKKVHRTLIALTLLAAVLLGAALCEARPTPKPAAKPAAAAPANSKPAAPAAGGVVNLNTATEEQLQLLPRIGPSKARAIIKYRSRQKFKTTADLTHVKGIGRKSFRLLRPYLVVQGETTLNKKPKRIAD